MKRNDRFKVWVNQGNRQAVCLAVLDGRALIEYWMPNGATYFWECDDFDPKAKGPAYGKIVNRQWDKLPQRWKDAMHFQMIEAKAAAAAANAEAKKRREMDALWAANTGFKTVAEALTTCGLYRPSICMDFPVMAALAEDYDAYAEKMGDPRRAYRYGRND